MSERTKRTSTRQPKGTSTVTIHLGGQIISVTAETRLEALTKLWRAAEEADRS